MIEEKPYRNILSHLNRSHNLTKTSKPNLLSFRILRIGKKFKINYAWTLDKLPTAFLISINNSYYTRPPSHLSNQTDYESFKNFCLLIETKFCFLDSLMRIKDFGDRLVHFILRRKPSIEELGYLLGRYEIESSENLLFVNWLVKYDLTGIFQKYPGLEIEFKQHLLMIYFNEPLENLSQVERLIEITRALLERKAI